MRVIQLAQADDVVEGLGVAGNTAGYSTATPIESIIANLINALLSVSGLILLILLVYAGILYMTAAGDDDKTKKAKRIITSAIIGLIIVLAAFAIAQFVIDQLVTVVSNTQAAS